MIFNSLEDVRSDRACKALTGLTREQFRQLLKEFETSNKKLREDRYESGKLKIKSLMGRRGYLETQEQKLFFVLFYLKNYPTYDVLGHMFGFSGGHAYDHLQKLIPVLQRALSDNDHLPSRDLSIPVDLKQAIDDKGQIIIDATERTCVRPQDKVMQKARYSGKKKHHTVKNLLITDSDKKICYLSYTFAGSVHDYALLKQELPANEPWFETTQVWVDLGFQGIKKDYAYSEHIQMPHKKPQKSKKNPQPALTEKQKEDNRKIAKMRVRIEHAIGGMKWFHCLMQRVRNHLDVLIDNQISLCAGIYNMKMYLKTLA